MDVSDSSTWLDFIALFSIAFGAVIEFFPFLLAGIAPPLSYTGIIQLGNFSIPANILYGFLFIGGGAFILFYYLWWRID